MASPACYTCQAPLPTLRCHFCPKRFCDVNCSPTSLTGRRFDGDFICGSGCSSMRSWTMILDRPMSQLLCQKWLFAQTLLHVAVCDERKQDSCLIFGIWKKMAPFQLFPNMENGQICRASMLLAWLSNFDRYHRNLDKKCRTRCALHLARKATCSWLQLSEYIAFFRNYYYLFRNYIYLYFFFNT